MNQHQPSDEQLTQMMDFGVAVSDAISETLELIEKRIGPLTPEVKQEITLIWLHRMRQFAMQKFKQESENNHG